MATISFDKAIAQNFEEASKREWLETNGLGGWASSTISGAHTRRYHGLLVTATRPPVGRMVLLSKLDETIISGEEQYDLGCNYYPNTVHPRGYEYLQSFAKDIFPHFEYEVGGICLQKTIVAIYGENTTLILYHIRSAPSPFLFELRPLVAGRDYHGLVRANDAIHREADIREGFFRVQPYDGLPELFISIPGATFEACPDWFFNFEYPAERDRGLDFHEDLFSYGIFKLKLNAGQRFGVIISTLNPSGKEAFELYERERQRRQNLVERLPLRNEFSEILTLAADQFSVQRGAHLRTLIAGYHWFSDWGRDTMISLPGIMLVTGRYEEARKVLQSFAESVSQGMLPNRYPDGNEPPEYNTADASLWFFVAVEKYFRHAQDKTFVRSILPVLQEMIQWHDRGTRYNIHVDRDGLLYSGEPGVQLTWMDAKVGNWVVTPRQGKAVEINALWYNALRIVSHLLLSFNESTIALGYEEWAEQVKERFNELFWYKEGQYLYDYVDGDYHETAVRPNQIFAISLPFPLLSAERAKSVLQVVKEKLLTPFGLRSLAPDHPDYRPRYEGDPVSRDHAYHQGTVWLWLLGPLIDALVRIYGQEGKNQAKAVLNNIVPHLSEAGIGSLSEIFDGDPPHAPKGCIAQAWSVAEILRVYMENALEE
ncbi:MAG: amylo-alpha-1,6-glucosidase [Deltaproteobacteria bacterium]|nr:amylo-alpha-1,6-glucosidase [Deltaproteobacteria bacterium]